MRLRGLLATTALALFPSIGQAQETIAASILPTYSIAQTLAQGTGFAIKMLPDRALPLALQGPRLARMLEADTATLSDVTAVISVRSVYPNDPLFSSLRSVNIRLVEIDALVPIERHGAPVTLIAPNGVGPIPYPWLSAANAIRMIDIIAGDMARLTPTPTERDQIRANAEAAKQRLGAMRARFDMALLAADAHDIFVVGHRLDAFVQEAGLFPMAVFEEGAPMDFSGAVSPVLLHSGELASDIAVSVERAGGSAVRIETLNPGQIDADASTGSNGFEMALCRNMEALVSALVSAPRQAQCP